MSDVEAENENVVEGDEGVDDAAALLLDGYPASKGGRAQRKSSGDSKNKRSMKDTFRRTRSRRHA